MIKVATAALALALTAGAVPDGLGGWDNGTRDPVPPSSSILRWRYDMAFDAAWRDRIMYGVASVDYDLPSVRLLYSLSDSPTPQQMHFAFAEGPPAPGCVGPGVCELGFTTCGVWGANVDAIGVDGAIRRYRTCAQFRVLLRVANIEADAAAHELPLASYAHGIVRHEVGHVLGLNHEDADLTAGTNACARALVEAFVVDDAASWVAVPRPEACE